MYSGEHIDKKLLVKKYEGPSDFRSDILNCCGSKVGGLTHGRFLRSFQGGDEIWKFEDKSDEKHPVSGFVILREDRIVDLQIC